VTERARQRDEIKGRPVNFDFLERFCNLNANSMTRLTSDSTVTEVNWRAEDEKGGRFNS
jgi:hypothetical protein